MSYERAGALGAGGSGMTNPMTASGDIIVGGTAGAPAKLVKGTDGQFLKLAAGTPSWAAESGLGDTLSAATSVDDTIARYNGTNNKTIQDSVLKVNDTTGLLTNTANATMGLTSSVVDGGSAVAFTLDADNALANASAKLLSITNNSVEKLAVDKDGNITVVGTVDGKDVSTLGVGDTLSAATSVDNTIARYNGTDNKTIQDSVLSIADTTGLLKNLANATFGLTSSVADGGSAVAFTLDADNALSTAGAKILSLTNNSVEKAYIDKDGLGSFGVIRTKTSPVYNVKEYGLTGDGVTDDGVAFRALLATVIAAGGGVIYFPKATYLMTLLCNFASTANIHVIGDGVDNTIIDWTSDLTAGHVQWSAIGSRSSIKNMTFKNHKNYSYQHQTFSISGDDIIFENVKVSQGLYGIASFTGNRNRFINFQTAGDLLQFALGGTEATFIDCKIETTAADRACQITGTNHTFINTHFVSSGAQACTLVGGYGTFINCYFSSSNYDLDYSSGSKSTLIGFRSAAGNYSKINGLANFNIIPSSSTYYGQLYDTRMMYVPTTVNAATYNLIATDNILNVTYTATGAVTNLQLMTAQTLAGRNIIIKDAGGLAGTNSITITTEGSQLIDGLATYVIDTDYGYVKLYCDGTNWFIIS